MLLFQTLFVIAVFCIGAIVGSFLNVFILRYNTGLSAVKGRSICFSCGKTLSWYELIPILSFVIQKGRCRGCGSKISWQYPLVETITGLLFILIFLKFNGLVVVFADYSGVWPMLISFAVVSLLLSITVYDFKHKIIPDGMMVAFSILAIVNTFYYYFTADDLAFNLKTHLIWYLAAGPILALPLFLIWLFSKGKWMGLGDPKLVLGIGWFFGPFYGLSALILSFWSGAIYGIILIILSKMKWHGLEINGKTEVPFGPFLVLGFLIVFFFNVDILQLAPLIP